jgi:hypothetical protein
MHPVHQYHDPFVHTGIAIEIQATDYSEISKEAGESLHFQGNMRY